MAGLPPASPLSPVSGRGSPQRHTNSNDNGDIVDRIARSGSSSRPPKKKEVSIASGNGTYSPREAPIDKSAKSAVRANREGNYLSSDVLGAMDVSRDVSTGSPLGAAGSLDDDGKGRKKFDLDNTNLELGQRAGIRMAKAASGSRLKREVSYRGHADTKKLQHAIAHDQAHTTAVATGEGDDVASLASTALTEDLARRRRRKGVLSVIPLWVQVCILMMIPIIFVTVYLSITLQEAMRNVQFIRDNADIIRQCFICDQQLQLERARSNEFVFTMENATRAQIEPRMLAQWDSTDSTCNELQLMAQSSRYDVLSGPYFDVLRGAFAELAVLRFAVQSRRTNAMHVREVLRQAVADVTNGIAMIAKESVVVRRLVVLKELRSAGNHMGMCRAAGQEIVYNGQLRTMAMKIHFKRYCVESFRRYFRDFRQLANNIALEQYNRFMEHPDVAPVMEVIEQIDRLNVGEAFVMDMDTYFDMFTDVIALIGDMSNEILMGIESADTETGILAEEAIKLSITLFVSLLGVLFVSRAQRLGSERVDYALERTHKLSLAVQAFIPRNFLRLMAVESILNLERGDQTLVAVTMLFCDIRNFTGISENMTNEQLFDWLQSHLTRMTRATEKHRGFVDKFVGDAVSAIFLTPADACHCAVTMQSVTDALCSELVAHNEDHMVRIGVGVHQAIVGVGILGNDKHHSCAIVSEDVNVPAQLEALTKLYGSRIIVTANAFSQLKPDDFSHRLLGTIRLAVQSEKEFEIYDIWQADPLAAKRYKKDSADLWEEVLALRRNGNYAAAAPLLDRIDEIARVYKVKDGATAIKRNNTTPYDQFDMD